MTKPFEIIISISLSTFKFSDLWSFIEIAGSNINESLNYKRSL